MSGDSSIQRNTFFNRIGDAFKRGWKNGNLAKGITALGATTFTVGLTGAMIHNANNNHGCCGGSIWSGMLGGGFNYPMGMGMGMPNPSFYMGNMYSGLGGYQMPGMSYPMMPNLPSDWGIQWMQNWKPTTTTTYTPADPSQYTIKQNNQAAEKWDANQSTDAGSKFDNATQNISEGQEVKLTDNTYSGNKAGYTEDLSNLAKSYAAHIENTEGNTKDQKITLQEFIRHELSKLPADATEQDKYNAQQLATITYNKVDLNQDGQADWKELAALMATYDSDSQGKLDGKFSYNEAEVWANNLCDTTSTVVSQKLQENYKKLFGGDSE